MFPTLLDTKTGKIAVVEDYDFNVWWWTEGNGSCDCNRSNYFEGLHEELVKEIGMENVCFGCKRIIAIDVHGDLEGFTKKEIINKMNEDYPYEKIYL